MKHFYFCQLTRAESPYSRQATVQATILYSEILGSMSNLKNTKQIVLDGLVTLIQSHGVAHTIPHFLINATVWGYYITHFGCFGSKMRQINHAVITHTVAQVR